MTVQPIYMHPSDVVRWREVATKPFNHRIIDFIPPLIFVVGLILMGFSSGDLRIILFGGVILVSSFPAAYFFGKLWKEFDNLQEIAQQEILRNYRVMGVHPYQVALMEEQHYRSHDYLLIPDKAKDRPGSDVNFYRFAG